MRILLLLVVAGLMTSVMGASINGGQTRSHNEVRDEILRRSAEILRRGDFDEYFRYSQEIIEEHYIFEISDEDEDVGVNFNENYIFEISDEDEKEILHHSEDCSCRDQCIGNTGMKIMTCHENRSQYILCEDTTCNIKTCPDNHMYDSDISACMPCPAGQHVDPSNQFCVCDRGTWMIPPHFQTDLVCATCPTNAIITPYDCFCNSTQVLYKNVCRSCPSGSVKRGQRCDCVDPKMFWNAETSSCLACPGEWVPSDYFFRPKLEEECQCLGRDQVFNRVSVTCVNCPENSAFLDSFSRGPTCRCSRADHIYNRKTNTCVQF